jgi:predicted nucleotidyltransferase
MTTEVENVLKNIKTEFIPALQESFGQDLKAVILYGSAARDSYIKGVSDVNLLVLTGSPHPDLIMQLGKKSAKLIQKHRLSLHFLTESEFLNSSDVFPMEYYDIKQDHVLLWGEDPLAKLSLTPQNLRHQVEERLRGSVNALRQALLASQGKNKPLAEVLINWYGSQAALFRGVLRLLDRGDIPNEAHQLIKAVAEAFEIDSSGMEELVALRESRKAEEASSVAVNVLGFLTALTRKIDAMEKS